MPMGHIEVTPAHVARTSFNNCFKAAWNQSINEHGRAVTARRTGRSSASALGGLVLGVLIRRCDGRLTALWCSVCALVMPHLSFALCVRGCCALLQIWHLTRFRLLSRYQKTASPPPLFPHLPIAPSCAPVLCS